MKKTALILAFLGLLLFTALPCLGRGGGGGGGGGWGHGAGAGGWSRQGDRSRISQANPISPAPAPVRRVCDGRPFSHEGVVVHEIGPQEGQGLVLLVDGQAITIYGIGPQRFWHGLGLDRPRLGKQLSVQGYTVDYNGVQRHMATILVMEGRTVNLRQPGNCQPAWQGSDQPAFSPPGHEPLR